MDDVLTVVDLRAVRAGCGCRVGWGFPECRMAEGGGGRGGMGGGGGPDGRGLGGRIDRVC